jgi:hypothetical protein
VNVTAGGEVNSIGPTSSAALTAIVGLDCMKGELQGQLLGEKNVVGAEVWLAEPRCCAHEDLERNIIPRILDSAKAIAAFCQ